MFTGGVGLPIPLKKLKQPLKIEISDSLLTDYKVMILGLISLLATNIEIHITSKYWNALLLVED